MVYSVVLSKAGNPLSREDVKAISRVSFKEVVTRILEHHPAGSGLVSWQQPRIRADQIQNEIHADPRFRCPSFFDSAACATR